MQALYAGPLHLERLATGQQDRPYELFGVTPLAPTIGAEVTGVSLASIEDPDNGTFDELRRALLEWKVLFFRDQHLSSEQHRRFAQMWGPLELHPFLPVGEAPEVVRFEKGADEKGYENMWHSDVSWREDPSFGSVLRAVDVPATGGDTMWADMAVAFDCLPDEIRQRIDGLTAIHDFRTSFGVGMDPETLAQWEARYPPAEHPVVRTIPETGRRVLYVNEIFTDHIVGLDADASDRLLDRLLRQPRIPELQCRFRWRAGDVAMWDNRSTQHYAISDYYPARRVMERATIIGARPI